MKDFKIDDIVRYLITGIWIYFLLYQNNVFPNIIKLDHEFVVTIVAFSLGALVYSVFRSGLYPLLQKGLDFILPDETGRNYIKRKFVKLNWGTRNDIWVLFHQKFADKFPGHYSIWLSSFITMYTVSICTLAAIVLGNYQTCEKITYIIISIILFAAATYSNFNYEIRFFNNSILISSPNFKEFVQEYLEKRDKSL